MRRTALVSVVALLALVGGPVSRARNPALVGIVNNLHLAAGHAASSRVTKPHVVWKSIPFGPKRRREMAAYSKRHYGTW